jgi:hypothetical protein
MEQILEKKLGILIVGYLERTIEEMVPPMTVVTCISTFNGNVERPLKDQEVNTTY